MDPQYRLKTVQTALDLIEYFVKSPRNTLGISEIAAGMGIGKTEIYRLLQNLSEYGYIEEDSKTRKYRLGLKFMYLGQVVRERIDLVHEANSVLEELARETGETTHLLVPGSQGPVCVAERQTRHRLRFFTQVGVPLPWHAGAASRVLLAYMPREFLENVLSVGQLTSYTPHTITDPKSLRLELERIVASGYAVSTSELTLGAREVAAPICDDTGAVVATVSVACPAERMDDEQLAAAITPVVRAALAISRRLRYNSEFSTVQRVLINEEVLVAK